MFIYMHVFVILERIHISQFIICSLSGSHSNEHQLLQDFCNINASIPVGISVNTDYNKAKCFLPMSALLEKLAAYADLFVTFLTGARQHEQHSV